MKFYKILLIIFVVMIFFSFPAYGEWKRPVALQPLGEVDAEILRQVEAAVNKVFCGVKVEIRPAIELPEFAYYKPRKRYRSLKLLRYLEHYYLKKVKKSYVRIIGITTKDISTTKGEDYDWGIFGQAFLKRGPCIGSTFRLRRGAKSESHFMERLIKVINHELGHTFGVPHCPTQKCIMQDARGSIKTVDNSDGKFCALCKGRLFRVVCK